MSDSTDPSFTCSDCGVAVQEEANYCPQCGAMFSDTTKCSLHSSNPATGVCLICLKPFCKECAGKINGIFLCDAHNAYEIYEGMARIAGCTDNVFSQFITSCLEQAGFHPFLYSMRFNPGADVVSIQKIYRVYGDHPICELKILVPLNEVLEAEKTLDELELSKAC